MRFGSRLARAVRTKSASSTATISTRMIRARIAAGPIASARTGRTYADGVSLPATGSQPRLDAEHVDEADADEEVGDGAEHDAASVVKASSRPAAVAAPGEHAHRDAQRHGDRDGDQEGEQRELRASPAAAARRRRETGSCEISEVPRSPVNRPCR